VSYSLGDVVWARASAEQMQLHRPAELPLGHRWSLAIADVIQAKTYTWRYNNVNSWNLFIYHSPAQSETPAITSAEQVYGSDRNRCPRTHPQDRGAR
jgi:hypothetical protein